MSDERKKENVISDRYKREFVEFYCPTCRVSKIVCLPEEPLPHCDNCRKEMVFKEVLTEGKY